MFCRRQSDCAIMLFGLPNCMMSSGADASPRHPQPTHRPRAARSAPRDDRDGDGPTLTAGGDISLAGRPAILMARGSTIPHIMFRRHQTPRAIMPFGPPNGMMSSGADAARHDVPQTSDPLCHHAVRPAELHDVFGNGRRSSRYPADLRPPVPSCCSVRRTA